MEVRKMTMSLVVGMIATGLIAMSANVAEAKYVKPDAIKIIQKIAKDDAKVAMADTSAADQMLAAELSDVMERLITIAAEKYGIIFIVQDDSQDFFSSQL